MTEQEWIEKLREEGYIDLRSVELAPNFNPGEHDHEKATVHVVLKGQLTIKVAKGEQTYNEGDRVDFPAGTVHKAAFGPDGCTMIVGVKPSSNK